MIRKIFVYGDSISMQWGVPFAEKLKNQYEYNRFGGTNSYDLAAKRYNGESSEKMLTWIRDAGHNPETLLLFNCGLHDIKRNHTGKINVLPTKYEKNLQQIIDHAKCCYTYTIWISTTPIDNNLHARLCDEFVRKNEDVVLYNQIAANVMNRNLVPIIDLYSFTEQIKETEKILYSDHVHMTEQVSKMQAAYLLTCCSDILKSEFVLSQTGDIP